MKPAKHFKFSAVASLFIFMMSIFSGAAYGQKATFTKCELKHNVVVNGSKMLQCRFTLSLTGMKSHDIRIIMFIEHPKGTTHSYKDQEGFSVPIQTYEDIENNKDNLTLKDMTMGFYNSELSPKPGTNKYYVHLIVYDATTWEQIGSSPYMSYTQTGKGGNSASSVKQPASKSSGKWSKVSKGNHLVTCAENAATIIEAVNKVMANGTNIMLGGENMNDQQEWYFLPVEDYYYICSATDHNYVLDVKKAVVASGTNIQLYKRNNTKAQRWYLEACNTDPGNKKLNHEAFFIRSALNPDYVMECEYMETGANIRLNRYNGKKRQMWRIF